MSWFCECHYKNLGHWKRCHGCGKKRVIKEIRPKHAPLTRDMFYVTYANLPFIFRDKIAGLTWTEIYDLLHDVNQ